MSKLDLSSFTPALYLPWHYGRYRTYPFDTTTPIPGAGYGPARLRWGEQEINLDGARPGKRYVYGNYERNGGVPLLGFGQTVVTQGNVFSRFAATGTALFTGRGYAGIPFGDLAEYAKIAAVGMFVGVPVAAALGAWGMHRHMAKKVKRNRRRSR